MPVKNRLALLIAEKTVQTGEKITLTRLAEETGVSHTTLTKYMSQKATRFDGDVLERICKYFGVQVDKLIYIDPDPSEQLKQ